jgi:hypothetical protein
MRLKALTLALVLAFPLLLSAVQDPKKSDKDNKTIVVTGCVEGGYLRVHASDPMGSYTERYRLHGPKQLMKELQREHNNHVLEITGRVTDGPGSEHVGHVTKIGKKTTIYTGAKEIPDTPSANEMPTLDIKSYTEQQGTCSGKS